MNSPLSSTLVFFVGVLLVHSSFARSQCTGRTILVSVGLIDKYERVVFDNVLVEERAVVDYAAVFLEQGNEATWSQQVNLIAQDNMPYEYQVVWMKNTLTLGIYNYTETTQDGSRVRSTLLFQMSPNQLPYHASDALCPNLGRIFRCAISVLCADVTTVVPSSSDLCERTSPRATAFHGISLTQKDFDMGLLFVVLLISSFSGFVVFVVVFRVSKHRMRQNKM